METIHFIAAILVVLGVIGSIVPALPGPLLSFAGLLLLFFAKPASVSILALLLFGFTMILLMVFDYLLPILGTKITGASRRGQLGAIIGAVIGIVFFPPLGIFLGAIIGATIAQIHEGKTFSESLKGAAGVLVGSIAAIILQTLYAITVAIYFFIKLF